MASISRGYSFGATETVTAAKLHSLVDSASIASIVGSEITTGTITSSLIQSVDGAKLTGLGNIGASSGTIPSANVRKTVVFKAFADSDSVTTGDGAIYFTCPAELNGMNLVAVGAHVYTASSSGTPTIQIYNYTDSKDMLSTRITIDANETDSSTATTAAVIDTTADDIATADVIRVDVDVAGSGTKGLEIRLSFQTP